MTVQATIILNLDICGPFLCSGTAPVSWGFDSTFDRDYLGRPYIDRSHIKGKLREAMKEIGTPINDLDKWFGKEGPMENGNIFFSDLRLKDTELEKKLLKTPARKILHRIAMDNENHVVKSGALQVMENAFPGGREADESEKSYTWKGTISYVAFDDDDAKKIHEEISLGLKWMARLGAEKGIGFGRMKSVDAELMKPVAIDLKHSPAAKQSPHLTLSITTDDVLMLGDIRIKANYQDSKDYITGSAIKGALAQALNTACGVEFPAKTLIDEKNDKVKKHFPNLVACLPKIRFTHAFPSTTDKRPVIIPYSVVSVDGKHCDVALHKEPMFFGDQLPSFQIDWKEGDYPKPDVFGWATPLKFAKTRTAIEDRTRRADDGRMFTYQYVCPRDEEGTPISWIGGIYLDGIPKNDLPALQGELECALGQLRYLGKRASLVKAKIKTDEPGQYKPVVPFKQLDTPAKDIAVVALQSDALMVKAEDLIAKGQTAEGLDELYKAYWKEITGGACELSHFFAMQKIRGGFLRLNKKKQNESYYPYYLTEAGSVFVLTIKKIEAQQKFQEWKQKGLPLPRWAVDAYAENSENVWKRCPYVPENGYGEVAINMDINGAKDLTDGGKQS